MTMISTYDPKCEATCPKCGFVKCRITYGCLIGYIKYMIFYHDKCGTTWRVDID